MRIHVGFDITLWCPQSTPLVLLLNVHPERAGDLEAPERLLCHPQAPLHQFHDDFGNLCTRLVAGAGETRLRAAAVVADSGAPDPVAPAAAEVAVAQLPDDALLYLRGSRYCETDVLAQQAWGRFGQVAPGWARVQAICDFVHHAIRFDYQHARATRTAAQALAEGIGVCRDYAHLAIALCRAMNIPARYCTGYLGDIGIPPAPFPMDFSAWFEVYLGGRWFTFDARHNTPRIGRVLMARGRDAADVAMISSFGPHRLQAFSVWTDEAPAQLLRVA